MKTPRELLLERHAEVTPRLDALRHEVVAELSAGPRTTTPRAFGAWIKLLWRELIGSARLTWGGLAAAWAIIALLNLAQPEPMPGVGPVAAGPTMAGETLRVVLTEQRELRAELLGFEPQGATQREPRGTPSGSTRPRSARNEGMRNI